MSPEDSAVRRLDEIFNQTNEADVSLDAEEICAVQATREQFDTIVRFFQYHPEYTRELNNILEKSVSAQGIINDMDAFIYPDGEDNLKLDEFDKKVVGFINLESIRQMVRNNIGARSVGARDIY